MKCLVLSAWAEKAQKKQAVPSASLSFRWLQLFIWINLPHKIKSSSSQSDHQHFCVRFFCIFLVTTAPQNIGFGQLASISLCLPPIHLNPILVRLLREPNYAQGLELATVKFSSWMWNSHSTHHQRSAFCVTLRSDSSIGFLLFFPLINFLGFLVLYAPLCILHGILGFFIFIVLVVAWAFFCSIIFFASRMIF